MHKAIALLVWFAAIGVAISDTPALAQQADSEPEFVLPESPTGLPMEAVWDESPESADGKLQEAGPYRVSRWGDIVIRGRPEDGRIVSALWFIQCGGTENPATQVTMIGEPPDDLCDKVIALEPGRTQSVDGENYTLYGQSSGWTVIDFAQALENTNFHSGWPPASDSNDKDWGVSSLGAVFRNQNGQHVFFAPGETIKLSERVSFVVEPVMDEGELGTILAAAVMSNWGADSAAGETAKIRRPPGFYVVFVAIPLLLSGVFGYRILRSFRRRRGGKTNNDQG